MSSQLPPKGLLPLCFSCLEKTLDNFLKMVLNKFEIYLGMLITYSFCDQKIEKEKHIVGNLAYLMCLCLSNKAKQPFFSFPKNRFLKMK